MFIINNFQLNFLNYILNFYQMKAIRILKEFQETLNENIEKIIIVNFFSAWHDQSLEYVQSFLPRLNDDKIKKNVIFLSVNSDRSPQILCQFKVDHLPTTIIFQSSGRLLARYQNQTPLKVFEELQQILQSFLENQEIETQRNQLNLLHIISQNDVVLLTNKSLGDDLEGMISATFAQTQINDIKRINLNSEEFFTKWVLRQNNQQEYPILYIKQQFIGAGKDIGNKLQGAIQIHFPEKTMKIQESLQDELNKILKQNRVISFVEGYPDSQSTLETRNFFAAMNKIPCQFSIFYTYQRCELAMFLQEKYQNPLPYLFVDGNMVGNAQAISQIDILELMSQVPPNNWEIIKNQQEKLELLLQTLVQTPIIFIEVNVQQESYINSQLLTQTLEKQGIVFEQFVSHDQNELYHIKTFTQMERFPILFDKGEFISGCETILKHFS